MHQSGTLKITHKVRVKFSVGKYVDTMDCDVAPMSACPLLLGRPWQFDLDATHGGRSNCYSFVHKGVHHVLKPMPDNDIKAEVFAPVKKKKQAVEITPKPRTALLQEGENDVTEEEKQLFSDAIIPSKEITKAGIVLFKGGKENVAISAPKTTAGNLSQSLKIQFGSFSITLNKEDEIYKKYVMPCPIKFKGVNLIKRK